MQPNGSYQQAAVRLCAGAENAIIRRTMTGDRTEAAVQRIEQALARIARAADRARDVSPAAPPSVTALVERHETLRETVAQALGDLDRLLGELDA